MKNNLQKSILRGITDVFRPLLTVAPDKNSTVDFFQVLGWDVEALLGGDITPLTTILGSVAQEVAQVRQLIGAVERPGIASFAELKTALLATQKLGQALAQLNTLNLPGDLADKFYPDVLQKLLTIYLLLAAERVYYFFALAGIIVPDTLSEQHDGRYVKYVSTIPVFSFDRLLDFLKSPQPHIAREYWPNGEADFATVQTTNVVAQKLIPRLTHWLNSLGILATVGHSSTTGIFPIDEEEAQQATLSLAKHLVLPGGHRLEAGLYAGLVAATNDGPGVVVAPYGAAALRTLVGNWLVELNLSTAIGAILFRRDTTKLLGSLATNATAALRVSNTANETQVLGNQPGTSLQLGSVAAGVSLNFTAELRTIDAYISLGDSILAIHPDEGDSFLKKIVPAGGVTLNFNALFGWSTTKGLYFGGRAGLRNRLTINGNGTAGFLSVKSVDTALLLSDKLAASVAVSGVVTLGPVKVTVGETGLQLSLVSAPAGGNAGPFDVGLDFVPPKSLGLEVDSDTLSGGGYLFLDPAHHTYAGVAHLLLKTGAREINLNALGLLQTQLPGNPGAYSLVLLLTATFAPVQLGLGFTLSGLGGLLGVNRAANTDYLRGLVRGGGLGQLLFPPNVLDDPAAALALVDAAFPATEGRYVIGLMARLGWGVPDNLITLDVALLIELPASHGRLVILGVLKASLPSEDHELLRLRADFLGSVDFGAKQAAFDATLSDSKIWKFTLTGDLAFRLYQGNNPLFVLTAGGFHPAFQPPAGAGLTGLRRLTLALAQDNDRRITLASYFAVTSNTVQFGSHLDLYMRICRGLHVEGHFGFDVLFQFNPFHVLAHVEAGVAIKYGDRELLSLYLSLDVTGPGPWHIWGSASFKVWFVRIHVDVDTTIGPGATEPALPATDVQALLVGALHAAAGWEVEAPKTALPGGVVLRPPAAPATQFFLDPRGALVLRQRVAPLGLPLEKYGSSAAAPVGGQRFDLTELVVGTDHHAATGGDVEVVRDFFAPDQFRRLTDAQKLSEPSFQQLPCGLRLKSLAGLVADPRATRRVVEYEHKLLDGTSGGAKLKLSGEAFQQLARGGALGQEVQAAQPSARAPQPVGWAEDTYAVVHAADLSLYDPAGHPSFASQVEAEQFRQALVAGQPALAGEVLVVPGYQLELA